MLMAPFNVVLMACQPTSSLPQNVCPFRASMPQQKQQQRRRNDDVDESGDDHDDDDDDDEEIKRATAITIATMLVTSS